MLRFPPILTYSEKIIMKQITLEESSQRFKDNLKPQGFGELNS